MYKVFKLDIYFSDYGCEDVYVGGTTKEDILNNLPQIFPIHYKVIHREDWMDDCDWDEETDSGKYKEGDIVPDYRERLNNIREYNQLKEEFEDRIQEVPHMFTDTPYVILDSNGYCE